MDLCYLENILDHYGTNMKIQLDIDEIPDELYNQLLMAFVQKAIVEGVDVPRGAKVEEWNLTAELIVPNIH